SRQQALQRPVPHKSDLPRCARRCHHDPWLTLSPCAPERVYSRWAMHDTVPYIVRVGAFFRASRRCMLAWTRELTAELVQCSTPVEQSRTTVRETIWSSKTPLRYMPQLDSLRAVAVGLVLLYHFWRPARQSVHFGGIGVRLFFVLSGFLITGILLQSRTLVDRGETEARVAIRHFYIRRFLRIFPLYYFALAVACLGNVYDARAGIVWHVSYLSNVYFFLENAAQPGRWGGSVAHLWSLA